VIAADADRELVEALKRLGATVATVESCTGGQIAARLTSVAGSSAVFWGGWVSYDNSAKVAQIGVPPGLIAAKGAVSPEVARAMAEAGLARMEEALSDAAADASGLASAPRRVCVATTGIAGPGGATPAKPVGLCYFSLAASGMGAWVAEVRAPGGQDRAANQHAFADAALGALAHLVRTLLEGGA
jgi:nicotinamide-nucleotide amidase